MFFIRKSRTVLAACAVNAVTYDSIMVPCLLIPFVKIRFSTFQIQLLAINTSKDV